MLAEFGKKATAKEFDRVSERARCLLLFAYSPNMDRGQFLKLNCCKIRDEFLRNVKSWLKGVEYND